MSSVSDALERAAEEKARLNSESQEPFEPRRAEPDKIEPCGNGGDVQPPPVAPESSERPKSWRERIEEIFFGRDLRRLKSHPLVALEKDSPVAEQYRILREQVKTLRDETTARSIAVTSPTKDEGKTMVAVNLAAAFALSSEERVVLIDGDLRNPDVHRYFGVSSEPGLSDYLSSRSNGRLSDYLRPTLLPGLEVIPAGHRSELAPELLAKERMSRLLKEISLTFPQCRIILDTPPVLATSDPLVLTREVGGVIMVVRAGRTPREEVKKAIEILNSPKLLGLVLNGTERDTAHKYYHYGHHRSVH